MNDLVFRRDHFMVILRDQPDYDENGVFHGYKKQTNVELNPQVTDFIKTLENKCLYLETEIYHIKTKLDDAEKVRQAIANNPSASDAYKHLQSLLALDGIKYEI